eukprot:TRINITY_DN21665_c0_g1_i1.p1 TRINITY_DN21665_c0_g1~~TRINITY_DN21665_c0_g1_i1.p1  ORF type:complete len:812 (+),score=193.25 TRINITY_DN21665_c0_g1_i1:108-2543(+)
MAAGGAVGEAGIKPHPALLRYGARIRPLPPGGGQGAARPSLAAAGAVEVLRADGSWQEHSCGGGRVFDEACSQDDLWEAVGLPLAGDLLAMHSSCLVVCGGTDSGKTHTVFGGQQEGGELDPDPHALGVLPRVAVWVLGKADPGTQVLLSMAAVDGGRVCDLLNPPLGKGGSDLLAVPELRVEADGSPAGGWFARDQVRANVGTAQAALSLLSGGLALRRRLRRMSGAAGEGAWAHTVAAVTLRRGLQDCTFTAAEWAAGAADTPAAASCLAAARGGRAPVAADVSESALSGLLAAPTAAGRVTLLAAVSPAAASAPSAAAALLMTAEVAAAPEPAAGAAQPDDPFGQLQCDGMMQEEEVSALRALPPAELAAECEALRRLMDYAARRYHQLEMAHSELQRCLTQGGGPSLPEDLVWRRASAPVSTLKDAALAAADAPLLRVRAGSAPTLSAAGRRSPAPRDQVPWAAGQRAVARRLCAPPLPQHRHSSFGRGVLDVSGGPAPSAGELSPSAAQRHRAFSGHTDAVHCVTFSPSGETAVSCSKDGTVRVWSIPAGQELAALRGHAGAVLGCAVSPAGDLVASTGADGSVRFWDPREGELMHAIQGAHQGNAYGCCFAPSGQELATSGADGSVKLWSTRTGECLAEHIAPGALAYSAAFSPDGAVLASAHSDGVLRLRSCTEHPEARALLGHEGAVWSCRWHPSSAGGLVSAGVDARVILWDAEAGTVRRVLRGPIMPSHHAEFVCSDSGDAVAAAGRDGAVRVWRAGDGALVSCLEKCHAGHVYHCSVHGERLLTGASDGTIRLWCVDLSI